jgi:DNA-binding NtrC family response regulator
VRLPVSLDELEDLLQKPAEQLPADRAIVVVIDDDPSVRNSLAAVLKEKYTVRTCRDGIEGVRAVDEDVSCVVLDVKMPTHDGFWVCKHLRKRDADLPVIFHSGYQDLRDPNDAVNEFRAFGYVVKGGKLATLLDLISRAVRHTERRKASKSTIDRLRPARDELHELAANLGAGGNAVSVDKSERQK